MSDINIEEVLDNARQLGLPLLVIIFGALVLVLDGMDIQIISLAAPLLTREFKVSPASLGPVFAAALIGMALGGFALGALGDRWGRRLTLLISVALFSTCTLLSATAQSVEALTAWRLLTGIGLGGAVPNAMALLAEFTGPRWRTQAIAIAGVGVPIGALLGAVVGSSVLPAFGWRSLFIIGGLAPLATLGALTLLLPESPRFLAMRTHRRQALVKVLNRLDRTRRYSMDDAFASSEPSVRGRGGGFSVVIAQSLLGDTCWLWVIFFTNMLVLFNIASWSPVILTGLGLTLKVAVRGSIVFNLVGVFGGLVAAWMLARWGSRKPMAFLAILGSAGLWVISILLHKAAQAGQPPDLIILMTALGLVGFSMMGTQAAAYRLATHLYPTRIRASGIGWAAGFGRVGGITSSLVGGWLLAKVHGAGLFALLGGVVVLTLIGIVVIRKHFQSTPMFRAPLAGYAETTAAGHEAGSVK